MHVFDALVWHVAGHPGATCGDHVVLVLQAGRELVHAAAEEKLVVVRVEAAFTDSIEEVGRYVQSVEVRESSLLESLADDSSS